MRSGVRRLRLWTHLVDQAQNFIGEVLRPGDLAVDLTAGNGGDTLFLYRAVKAEGQVLAFDIQGQALIETKRRLDRAGAQVFEVHQVGPVAGSSGIYLIHDDHGRLGQYLSASPRAMMANLGFLPGGDRARVTRAETTTRALSAALDGLAAGGRLALVAYPGHPGGAEEMLAVEAIFRELPPDWQVLGTQVLNRRQAPRLFLAQKPASCAGLP